MKKLSHSVSATSPEHVHQDAVVLLAKAKRLKHHMKNVRHPVTGESFRVLADAREIAQAFIDEVDGMQQAVDVSEGGRARIRAVRGKYVNSAQGGGQS